MKILAHILLLLCFFPYLDLLNLGTDTQPNALLLGAVILVGMKSKKINAPLIILWTLFLMSVLLIFMNQLSFFLYVKNVLNYLSPPIVAMAVYNLLSRSDYKVTFKTFFIVINIYMIVGLVQMYIYPDFMTFLISDTVRGNMFGGRGVVSLCPEPAFYGSLCLFLMVFSLISFNKKENFITIPILFFQMIFLSRAATSLSIFAIAILLFTVVQVFRFRLKYVLILAAMLLVTGTLVQNVMSDLEDTRMGVLVNQFIDDPFLITRIDESVGVRFTYAVAPFLSLKHHHMLPMGLGNFKPFILQLYKEGRYRNFIGEYLVKEKDRLTGGINMVLFQLGFLGFLLPLSIYLAFRKIMFRDSARFAFLLFICLLFTQIQLMHSMIGMIIAIALLYSRTDIPEPTQLAA